MWSGIKCPYHLRLVDGAWYCIGYCHERKKTRTLAVDRMTALALTSESFQIPADFSVEEYLAASWAIERGEPSVPPGTTVDAPNLCSPHSVTG